MPYACCRPEAEFGPAGELLLRWLRHSETCRKRYSSTSAEADFLPLHGTGQLCAGYLPLSDEGGLNGSYLVSRIRAVAPSRPSTQVESCRSPLRFSGGIQSSTEPVIAWQMTTSTVLSRSASRSCRTMAQAGHITGTACSSPCRGWSESSCAPCQRGPWARNKHPLNRPCW